MLTPHVLTCQANECSYNCEMECCAPQVKVGDDHPQCDMFTSGSVHMSKGEPIITSCAVDECHYNDSMACSASGITMMRHSTHADCATFRH